MPLTRARQTVNAVSTRYVDNAYLDGALATFSNTGLTMVASRLYATVVELPAGTYGRIGTTLGTAGAAGKLLRLGYFALGSDGLPGALVCDPGANIAADQTAPASYDAAIASPLVLAVPTKLVAVAWSDGTPSIGAWGAAGRAHWGRTLASAAKGAVVYRDGLTFGTGAFPATFGAITAYSNVGIPLVMAQAN